MSIVLGLLLVGTTGWPGFAPTGSWAKPTPELAAGLLSPAQAADAVDHEFGLPIFQNGMPSSVRFIGRSRPTGDGFCARKTYYVTVYAGPKGAEEPQAPIEGAQLRQGNCDGIFAYLNPGASLADGKKVVAWFQWAQQIVRSPAPMPFALNCRSETSEDKCAAGARAALAALPLDKISVITRDFYRRDHRWTASVSETQPGQLFWDVEIDATPGRSTIDMTWKIPAPF